MVLLAVPFMAGLTLIITATGEWMLDLGRFLFGFSDVTQKMSKM